jgi:hypothetical protein
MYTNKFICKACANERHGIKTHLPVNHTCERKGQDSLQLIPDATELDHLPDDSYFIRLSSDPDWFVHYTEDIEGERYLICFGIKGAAIFNSANAAEFITLSKANNLEKVNAKEEIAARKQ